MKKQTIAALLSALVIPGLGQLLILHRKKRGLLFLIPATAALLWLLTGMFQRANALLTEAGAGQLPPDPIELLNRLSAQASTPMDSAASFVILACWLASIIDALFVREQA